MARVTITDCLEKISNRYEVPVIAAQRVRDINAGSEPVVIPGNDKRSVIALREIASGKLDIDELRNELVLSYKNPISSEFSAENLDEETIESKDLSDIDAELEFNAELTNDETEKSESESDN